MGNLCTAEQDGKGITEKTAQQKQSLQNTAQQKQSLQNTGPEHHATAVHTEKLHGHAGETPVVKHTPATSAASLISHTPMRVEKPKEEEFKLPITDQVKFLADIFAAFDSDSSGGLDTTEVKALMEAFQPDSKAHISKSQKKKGKTQPRLKVQQHQVDQLMKELDPDNNGSVDIDEFSNFFMHLLELKFEEFDDDSSGVIDINELNDFVDVLLGKEGGMMRTLSGQKVKATKTSMEQKRHKYIKKIQQGSGSVSVDEFNGFMLAILSEAITAKGTKGLPVGLRNMVDMKKTK